MSSIQKTIEKHDPLAELEHMSLIRTRVYKKIKKSTITVSEQVNSTLRDYPCVVYTLFYLLAAYIVIPIVDVPLLGLSISAPVFFVIASFVIFKPPETWFKQNTNWIFIALFIFFGIFLSTTLNGILGFGLAFDSSGIASLIQYAYWMIVFVITITFAPRKNVLDNLTTIFAWSILIVAMMRWVEALVFGRIGTANVPHYMSQNGYGFQFSVFTPFLFIKVFSGKHKNVFGWGLASFICLGATLINGSRGSWVAVAIGLFLFILVFFITNPKKYSGLIVLVAFLAILSGVVLRVSPAISTAVETRMGTFSTLEEDKSYLIRQALTQKGLAMFKGSPLIGVGAGRFTKNTAEITINNQIAYREKELQRKSSHNSYIQWLAEFGLLGAVPFGVLLIVIAVNGLSNALQGLKNNDLIPLGFLVSFVQMSVHMWVIAALTGTIAWFMYGLNVALIYRKDQQ